MTSSIRALARRLSLQLNAYPKLKYQARNLFLALPPSLRGDQFVHDHLATLHAQHGPQTFLLIGANDGLTDDHLAPFIRHRQWRGLAIEPVPQYYQEYCRNYRGYPVQCLNVALHDSATSLAFHYLEDLPENPLPAYAKGIGSFDQTQVKNVAAEIPGAEQLLRSIEVPCLSFKTLMEQSQMSTVDVVIIDTEGYDAQVILQMDLTRWQPKTIIFEHKLLSPASLKAALQHLENAGYQHRRDQADVLATKAFQK